MEEEAGLEELPHRRERMVAGYAMPVLLSMTSQTEPTGRSVDCGARWLDAASVAEGIFAEVGGRSELNARCGDAITLLSTE